MDTSLSLPEGYDTTSFLHKKIEKISAAIYIVTNLVADSEPLKRKLREESLCLLSVAAHAPRAMSYSEAAIHEITSYCLGIISVLEIAYYAGIMSEMNHAILKEELLKLLRAVEYQKSRLHQTAEVLSGMFFMPEKGPVPHASPKGQEQAASPRSSSGQGAGLESESMRKGKAIRRETILEMLKKQAHLSIKDFAKAIKGCSEKTIQRELLVLVKKGLLRRDGERRWSTYSIN